MQADRYINSDISTVYYSDFIVINEDREANLIDYNSAVKFSLDGRHQHEVFVKNFIPNSALIYPAAAIKTKAFDATLILNEDWDFLLNVLQDCSLKYMPVLGPNIFKTDRSRQDRRGSVNDHRLAEICLALYQKWPAPDEETRLARQNLFAASGITLPLELF